MFGRWARSFGASDGIVMSRIHKMRSSQGSGPYFEVLEWHDE